MSIDIILSAVLGLFVFAVPSLQFTGRQWQRQRDGDKVNTLAGGYTKMYVRGCDFVLGETRMTLKSLVRLSMGA